MITILDASGIRCQAMAAFLQPLVIQTTRWASGCLKCTKGRQTAVCGEGAGMTDGNWRRGLCVSSSEPSAGVSVRVVKPARASVMMNHARPQNALHALSLGLSIRSLVHWGQAEAQTRCSTTGSNTKVSIMPATVHVDAYMNQSTYFAMVQNCF